MGKSIYIIITSSYHAEISGQLIKCFKMVSEKDFVAMHNLTKFIYSKAIKLRENMKLFYDYMQFPFGFSSKECIFSEIEKMDISNISIIVDDVILYFPFVDKVCFFRLVAQKSNYTKDAVFAEMRIKAEIHYAQENRGIIRGGNLEYLNQIYNRVAAILRLSSNEKEKMKQIELQTYRRYVMVRKTGKELLDRAHRQNKMIILLTRSVYPISFLDEILINNGIDIKISCGIDANSEIKCVLQRLLKDVQVTLHVGSNYLHDFIELNEGGGHGCYFPKVDEATKTNMKLRNMRKNIYKSVGNGTCFSVSLKEIFDDPFFKYEENSMCNGDAKTFAQILLFPILLEFSIWMAKDVEKNGIDNLIMVMRDGYLIEKILKLLMKYTGILQNVEMNFAYLSRSVRYVSYAKENNGLFDILVDFPVSEWSTVGDFLKKRLLVTDEKEEYEVLNAIYKCTKRTKNSRMGPFWEYVPLYTMFNEIYIKNSAKYFQDLQVYCNRLVGRKKAAVFDIGYRGSVVRMLHDVFKMNCQGYHLLGKSFLNSGDFAWQNLKIFTQYSNKTMQEVGGVLNALLEEILSAPEGTAQRVRIEKGEVVVQKEEPPPAKSLIKVMQNAILEAVERFLKLTGSDCLNMIFDNRLEMETLIDFLSNPNMFDAKLFRNISFQDSGFTSSSISNLYEIWYNEKCGKGGICD